VIDMVATILAEMGWHGGPWFLVFPLFWIALLVGAWFLFRRRDDRGRTNSAEEILGERYARGEITAEEYQQRREVLRRRSA
jgi:putative membrane protein